MADFVEDNLIYPRLIAIAEGVQMAIAQNGLPIVERVSVQPGTEPVMDYVGNGKDCAEIIVNMMGATIMPVSTAETASFSGCQPELVFQVAVGVFRCAPTPKGNPPKMPTAADQLNATRLHLADMRASKRGICMALEGVQYEVNDFQPYGPEGGVVGGVWTVTVGGEE
jgi:hypothetical protein